MAVSRRMQGLKLPPIVTKAIKCFGFETKLKFWLFSLKCDEDLASSNHKKTSLTIQNHKLPQPSIIIAGLPISLVSDLQNNNTCCVPSNQLA